MCGFEECRLLDSREDVKVGECSILNGEDQHVT
jgi:hypothetical protein